MCKNSPNKKTNIKRLNALGGAVVEASSRNWKFGCSNLDQERPKVVKIDNDSFNSNF